MKFAVVATLALAGCAAAAAPSAAEQKKILEGFTAEINKCFGSAGGDPCKGPENVYPFSTCVSENTLNGVAPLVALFPADEQKGILGDAAKIAGGVKKCEDDTKESKDATEYNKCAGAAVAAVGKGDKTDLQKGLNKALLDWNKAVAGCVTGEQGLGAKDPKDCDVKACVDAAAEDVFKSIIGLL